MNHDPLNSEQDFTRVNKKSKMKKNRTGIKIFTIVILIIVIGILILLFPCFNVDTIEILGNEKVTDEEILDSSLIVIGNNIFKVNSKKAENNIENIPYIYYSEIKRKFPNKIEISVAERKPIGYILFMGSYILIDMEGYVLEVVSDITEFSTLCLIEGISFNQFNLGQKLIVDNEKKLEEVVKCFREIINNGMLSNTNKIDIRSVDNIKIESSGKIVGILGDTSNLNYKLSFFKEILKQLNEGQSGYVDLRIKKPTFTEIK